MRTDRKQRRSIRQAARCGLATLGVLAVANSCTAADRFWTNTAGGTFSTTTNWQNGIPAGVNDVANFNNSSVFFPPGQASYTVNFGANAQTQAVNVKNDFVTFNLNGRTYTTTQITGNQIGSVGGAGTFLTARSARLTIQNGTFNFNAPLTDQMLIGAVPGGVGTLVVTTGGVVTGAPNLFVGTASATGSLIVNGGTVTTSLLDVGSGVSSSGNAVITLPFSSVTTSTLLVGNQGNGTMLINLNSTLQNNGTATIGNLAGSSGLVTVDTTGRWSQTGPLIIGADGAGSLVISGGGSVSCAGLPTNVVGRDFGSTGRVDVIGGSSRWINSGPLQIGLSGAASMNIIDGGVVQNTAGAMAVGIGSNATVTVDGVGSMWNNSGFLTVGGASNATLTVSGGGVVQSNGGNVRSGLSALATVTGPGSRWINTGSLTVGESSSFSNRLMISNGGSVHNTSATISNANVEVTGANSLWTTPGPLIVGQSGSGSLSINSGGQVTSSTATIGRLDFGRVTVRNAGSEWVNTGVLCIGDFEPGHLEISNGGRMQNTGVVEIGLRNGGDTATVRVTDANSQWVTDWIYLGAGHGGTGSIVVAVGGVAESTGAHVPNPAALGSSGTVTVSGSGPFVSRWDIATSLFVGVSDPGININGGTVRINGGLVSVADQLVVGDRGTIDLNGGTLSVGTIVFGATPIFNLAGTLRFTGDANLTAPFLDKLLGTSHTVSFQQHLAIDGTPTLQSTLVLNGGSFTVPTLAVGSPLQFDSGTFNLTNDSLTIGTAGLFGDDLVLVSRNINVTNATTIEPAARLTLQGGRFFSGGGITNDGEIAVNNTATFQNAIINNGELRVSTGATANFFGNVTGAGSFTGGGGKVFMSGSDSSLGHLDTPGSTAVDAGATLAVNRIREQSLIVTGTARINPGGTNASTSRLSVLSVFGGGILDLSDNALVIDYDGTSPIDNISTRLTSGFAGGSWDGIGINSSIAASIPDRALGFAEASSLFTTFPATFRGESVDDTALLLAYTRYGDANLDGLVNLADFNRLAANFGSTSADWSRGDFNYDGTVNLADFNRLAANFGLQAGPDGPTPQDWSTLAAAVPEPSVLGLAGMAALAAMSRGRRRRDAC